MFDYVYCVSCNLGSEAALKRELEKQLPQAVIHCPTFERQEKKDGKWMTKTCPLIPGYLLIYSTTPVPAILFLRISRVVRLLGYLSGNPLGETSYPLQGSDLEFARWIYANEGTIKTSEAAMIGSRVQIISGPLKHYEGKIKKFDKHKRSALVTIAVGALEKEVWLAFSWVNVQE